MEKSNSPSELNLIFKYALKDLSRNYKKLSSIIVTLFISLFILSAIFTIEDSLKKELNDNAKALLGGDLEIDYNRNEGNLELVNQVKEFTTISQMIEFSTMVSTIDRDKNKSLFTRIKTVDTKYPLYGKVDYEPAGAFDRMHNEPNTLLINESLSKNLNLKIDDKNISLFFNGLVDFSDDLVDFDFDLDLLKADLNNINDEYDNSISGSANVKLRGSRIENLIGDLSINNLKFTNSDINNTFEKFDAQLRYNDDIRIVNLNSSDAVSGIIIGEYDIFSLKKILLNSIGSHYSNYKLNDNIDFQNISFNLNIKPKLAYLINSKLDLDESTFVSGNFKSDGDYEIAVKSNYINYDNIETENIDLKFSNNGGEFKIKKLKSSLVEGTNFYVDSTFSDDTLYVCLLYTSPSPRDRG